MVIVHNWLLAALSAWLFVALGTELIIQISRHGFWAVFCQEFVKFTVGKLPLFYYINYLFKVGGRGLFLGAVGFRWNATTLCCCVSKRGSELVAFFAIDAGLS